MNEFGNQIIFKQLLDRHQRIQIPMIQRDFAQGRSTEEEVREEFLNALHRALSLPLGHESLPLNLDFIYGSVEGDGETGFLPLDGQQRLTTLFLLHWYLAWKDNCQDDFQEMLCYKGASRFFYSVRTSSTEFFNELVKFFPQSSPDAVSSLKALIVDQPWYFRYWRLDPTIQSSLTMLDSIHGRFRSTEGFFPRLMDETQPVITFQLLDLENFGLSDDLYIKMNARGKPLTAFETFKARYEQELGDHFDGETRTIGGQRFPVAEFFARRMDTQWADFFWPHRNKETNLYDEAAMNLFRAVALVTRNPESDSYLEDISSLRNKSLKSSYAVFHSKGWLDRRFSEVLFMLLEAWSKEGTDFAPQLPNKQFFDEAALFTKAMSEPSGLAYTELVQFAGYVVFMREREYMDDVDPEVFQEWMRVIFNLSVNTSYDRPTDMQRSIAAILKLAPNSGNILEYLATTEKPTTGFSEQQIDEERLKAELIGADGSWRPLIHRAESHGYFRGQIEFLLNFCGATDKWNSLGDVNWGADEHTSLQDRFESYLKKAKMMFNTRGLASIEEYRWERALLGIGDYTLPSGGRNCSFLVNSSTDPASWKRLLRGTGPKVPEAREILHKLMDRLSEDASLEAQLDEIIAGETGLEPWRRAFLETPEAIEYCGQRAIRFSSGIGVYLLKKSQMNGAHAELFTFCLFQKLRKGIASEGQLAPLILEDYQSVSGTDSEPHVLLVHEHREHRLEFRIRFASNRFVTRIRLNSFDGLPDILALLIDSAAFQERENVLLRESSSTDIQNALLELAQALATTSSKDSAYA
jgi:hypothetical protein